MRIRVLPTVAVALVVVAVPTIAIAASGPSAPRRPADRSTATSMTATWDPGLGAGRRTVTHAAAALATRFLHDVDAAPESPFDKGMWSCPSDNGSRVTLAVRATPVAAPVSVAFTGCDVVRQAGHDGRTVTPAILRDLRAMAPAAFRRYLSG